MMLLAEAALRSSLLTAAVWLVLKLLRVDNPHIQMAAWSGVLLASLAMPLLMRWAPAEAVPLGADFYRPMAATLSASGTLAEQTSAPAAGFPWSVALAAAYLLVAAILTARLALGLVQSGRLVQRATVVRAAWTGGRHVAFSADLAMPVTVGRAILLPTEFPVWDEARRRAVLAHEASHAARGDFYLLALADLHRALFWLSPAAWWLDGRLADLAEACSDAAALAVVPDRTLYAQILIDLAGHARSIPAGVAMARRATVRRRVEQILAGGALPARLTAGRLVLVGAGMVPAILAAAGATTVPGSNEALLKQRLEDQARPRIAISLDPAILDKLVGYYAQPSVPDFPLKVTREGDHLFAAPLGRPAMEIFPENTHKFFSTDFPGQEDFQLDAAGRAVAVVLDWNGHELPADRLDEAAGRALETALAERIAANRQQPGSEAALRNHIAQIQAGDIDGRTLAFEGMAEAITAMLPQIRPEMVALGPVIAVKFEGVGPDGMDLYTVTHAKGARHWQIRLTTRGRIESMWFTPAT